jgi:hypothetical protein
MSLQIIARLMVSRVDAARYLSILADLRRLIMRYPAAQLEGRRRHLLLLTNVLVDLPLQKTHVVKFLFRLLVRYHEAWQTQEIMRVVADYPDSLLENLQTLQLRFQDFNRSRDAAAAYPARYRRSLMQYVAYLFDGRQPPLIELTEPDAGLTTYTDGARIFLPNRINLAVDEEAAEQNIALIFHSLVHEALHLGIKGHRGTYDFSFQTQMGKLLLGRIRKYRRTFDKNLRKWEGRSLFRQLAQEEGLDIEDKEPVLTDLVAFYMFARHQKLLQFLVNVFEDMRIERVIRNSGLKAASELHMELAVRRWQHPILDPPEAQLQAFLLQELVGMDTGRRLQGTVQRIEAELRGRFQQHREMRLAQLSPESSAVFAWEVYRLVVDHLPSKTVDGLDEQARPRATATEVSIRRQLSQYASSGSGGWGGRPFMFRRREQPANGPNVYEEFDHDAGVVVANATQVVVKAFVPTRQPYPPAPLKFFALPTATTAARDRRRSAAQFRFREQGDHMEMQRVIPALAAIRSGRPYDRRLYRTRDTESSQPLTSVLIDLSVSMEQRRAGMEARSIQLAIDVTKRLHQASREHGFDLQVFGVYDGGRQSVHLQRVALSDMDRIHCHGVAGARMGAAIRHLAKHVGHQRDHQIYVLTDDSGCYARHGNDEIFDRVWKNCATCQLRRLAGKGCHVELGKKANPREAGFFESMEYQYADLDHAIRTIPENHQVYYIELAQKPYQHLLDYYLPGRWWCSHESLDLATPPK